MLQIRQNCMSAVSAQDFDDHGQVEECLKTMLKTGKLRDNPDCVKVCMHYSHSPETSRERDDVTLFVSPFST